MIILKMTPEFFEDVFKERTTAIKCTQGLPENATLASVTIETEQGTGLNYVIAMFNNGKTEVTDLQLTFEASL